MLCTWSSIELPILYRLLFLFLNQIESLQVWGIIRPPYAEQDGSHVLPSRNIHLISCLNFVCWLDWVLASRKAVEKAAQFLQQQRENTWGALLFCWIIPSFLKGKFLLQEIFLPITCISKQQQNYVIISTVFVTVVLWETIEHIFRVSSTFIWHISIFSLTFNMRKNGLMKTLVGSYQFLCRAIVLSYLTLTKLWVTGVIRVTKQKWDR
jgi:hypothetical protein